MKKKTAKCLEVITKCSLFAAEISLKPIGISLKQIKTTDMKKLTDKELAVMNVLWDGGALSMRDILERLPEPQPHFNTVATFVRRLEQSGMITHKELGTRFFLYEPAISRQKYAELMNKESVNRFFNGSYMDFISCLVKQQEVSVDELKELINMVEKKK